MTNLYSWFLHVEWNLYFFIRRLTIGMRPFTKVTNYLFSMTFSCNVDEESNDDVGIDPSILQGVDEGGLNRSHGPMMCFRRRLSKWRILIKRYNSIPPEELPLDMLANLMVLFMFRLRELDGQHYPSTTSVHFS